MADSSDVDTALVSKLATDAQLHTLMPDGVFFDIAPPGSTRFVLLSLIEELDEQAQRARAFEDALYQIEARGLSTASPNMKGAAARIDELLDGQPLAVPGYSLMTMHREGRIRLTERDDASADLLWHRRGGHYRVVVSP